METRRDFLKKTALLSGGFGLASSLPASIKRALEIDPALGSTFLDAEHIVILMQENRSFDHCFGTLQGVRGFNDPRAISLPDNKPVWLQTNEAGETFAPFRLDIKDTKVTWMGDLPHTRASQVDANNLGKYDKWLEAKKSGNKKYANMPLTLGYYNRQDLPFNYAMADAFTICDQNFSSAMTSTTPNRSYFWTGKIMSEENNVQKANIRNDDYQFGKQQWKTFPEVLQENGIDWKFYQNEITCGGGFKDQENSWLGNFGCNLLEFFQAYHVQFAPRNVARLKDLVTSLPQEIRALQEKGKPGEKLPDKTQKAIAKKQQVLENAKVELDKWSQDNFNKLTPEQKQLFFNAFVINKDDKDYRSLATLDYTENGKQRSVKVPAGDILYQFRKEVNEGKLPTVSWVTPPQNFSDHPSAPWYGAWYVSEVLDILTKNPEVWKKTIFIVTYDENDGYYDHVPPFVIPDLKVAGSGKCSEGMESEVEYVRLENELVQGIAVKDAREGPVGLGFRVPMIVASPWSRGGKVCSQLFEHTSTLQFLENFFTKKLNKTIRLDNISTWRRAISGDLSAVFSPYEPALQKLPFLNRNRVVEQIYDARFKQEPSAYKALNREEIDEVIAAPSQSKWMPGQEKGMRRSCALPYELYADGQLNADRTRFELHMKAGNDIFRQRAQGSPFTAYVPGDYTGEKGNTESFRRWHFAAKAGDSLNYDWQLAAFKNNLYHVRLHGPNGFYREFIGDKNEPPLNITCTYERSRNDDQFSGNLVIRVNNASSTPHTLQIGDAYNMNGQTKKIAPGDNTILMNLDKSFAWYDITLQVKGFPLFKRHYAGHIETGKESFTDPLLS